MYPTWYPRISPFHKSSAGGSHVTFNSVELTGSTLRFFGGPPGVSPSVIASKICDQRERERVSQDVNVVYRSRRYVRGRAFREWFIERTWRRQRLWLSYFKGCSRDADAWARSWQFDLFEAKWEHWWNAYSRGDGYEVVLNSTYYKDGAEFARYWWRIDEFLSRLVREKWQNILLFIIVYHLLEIAKYFMIWTFIPNENALRLCIFSPNSFKNHTYTQTLYEKFVIHYHSPISLQSTLNLFTSLTFQLFTRLCLHFATKKPAFPVPHTAHERCFEIKILPWTWKLYQEPQSRSHSLWILISLIALSLPPSSMHSRNK